MDVITEFLNRVAYKFPKGYPDLNDPADRDLLESLMDLNEEEEKEEKEIDHKQRLLDLIKSADISNDVAQQIEKLLASSTFKPTIIDYINKKGFTPEKFKVGESAVDYIFKQLADSEIDDFIQYAQNPKKFSTMPKMGKFTDELGLPNKLIMDLIKIEPGSDAGGSNIGKGEVFLGLIFDDINNRAGGGDLNWNGKNFEIKGQGGRFGQQGGRSAGVDPRESITSGILSDEDREEFLESDTSKSMTLAIPEIMEMAKKEGKEKQAFDRIVKVLDQIYYGKGFAKEYFKSPSDLTDPEKIKKSITKILAKSYAAKNGVDYFLMFDKDSNYRLIDIKNIDEIVDQGALDTKVKSSRLGYNWNNPYPNMAFKI